MSAKNRLVEKGRLRRKDCAKSKAKKRASRRMTKPCDEQAIEAARRVEKMKKEYEAMQIKRFEQMKAFREFYERTYARPNDGTMVR